MKHDWITIALENGGVLTASKTPHGIYASMNWRKLPESVSGEHHSTLPDALTSLNSELENDAADECCPPPKKERMDDRYTIEAFKAATNTIMSALVRKWEAEGTRCGEEGRNSDDAWDADGDEWRERRAVYFECAEELKAALRKFSQHNAQREGPPTETSTEEKQ